MVLFGKHACSGMRIGQYTIEKKLGEGRYGVCFLARTTHGTPVTIKKMKSVPFGKKPENSNYESVILSQFSDSRIPKVLETVSEKHFTGIVLEFKEGKTIKELLFNQKYCFSEQEIFQIGAQLIQIIKLLHENRIVHRDLRIPNVILRDQKVHLIDFGLARWADGENYPLNLDYSFLGDFLIYLLYSSFVSARSFKKIPWYRELPLSEVQKLFLRRLLGLEPIYESIESIEEDFQQAFYAGMCVSV